MPEVLQEQDGLFSFEIKINGARIEDTVELNEIEIELEVNRISSATILIQDGGVIGSVNDPFVHSEGNDFIPGNEIEISLGYLEKRELAFKGIIVSQRLLVTKESSQIQIECKDPSVQMTHGRKNAIFTDSTDSDVYGKVAGQYSITLQADSTTVQHPTIVQHNCSDWDFILTRAEANNQFVVTNNGKLVIAAQSLTSSATYEINASQSIIEVELDLASEDLTKSLKINSWNPASQAADTVDFNSDDVLKQGDLSFDTLTGVMNVESQSMFTSAPISTDEMTAWAESLSQKAILSKIKGHLSVQGTTNFIPGDIVVLSGLNKRYNGPAFISKVTHEILDGDWTTTLYLGKNFSLHASNFEIEETKAMGLIPPVSGHQIGIVKNIVSENGDFKVQLTFPAFEGTNQEDGIWARMCQPYSSNDAGFFFFPEVGDEMLVTFINNDPRFPVVVGALYSEVNKAKEEPDDKNQYKSIVSKSGISIRFDDTDSILEIKTPGGNVVTMDDNASSIKIEDSTGNSCLLDSSGITLDSPKDITINSQANVNISAVSGIALSSQQDVTVEGMNIQNSANVGFTAKGNASAELSASGQTTVKGAMVMIN